MASERDLNILYEDRHVLVCYKKAGLAVQSAGFGTMDLESMLKNHLARERMKAADPAEGKNAGPRGAFAGHGKGRGPYLAVVHRLDQPVEGLLVFAKTPAAAASLSAQAQDGRMSKEYLALTEPTPRGRRLLEEIENGRERVLEDYLVKDAKKHMARIAGKDEKGAKKAVLYLSRYVLQPST